MYIYNNDYLYVAAMKCAFVVNYSISNLPNVLSHMGYDQRQRPVTYGQPEQKRSTSLASQTESKKVLGKVRKMAMIRNRYNQVSHLTQGSIWESDKKTIKLNITNESQEVSPYPAGDHRAAKA